MENEIKLALNNLLAGISKNDGEALLREMERLDEIAARGRDSLHPQLLHFLQKRSYAKAQQFLQGVADIPAGICGGRTRLS